MANPSLVDAVIIPSVDHQRSTPGHVFCTFLLSPTDICNAIHGGVIDFLIEAVGCFAIRSTLQTIQGIVLDVNISYMSGTPLSEEEFVTELWADFEARVFNQTNEVTVASVDVCNRKSRKLMAQGVVTMSFGFSAKL